MIGQAAGAILELNADEKLRQQIIDRQNAINDYYSEINWSRAEGRAEGLAEGAIIEKRATAEKLRQLGWSVESIAEFLNVAAVDVKIWLND